MTTKRNFLDLDAFEAQELRRIIECAQALKENTKCCDTPLFGKTLAMIFEKPSTRTRISFDLAMSQLGGKVVSLSTKELQLGRGETLGDTARVLSRYVNAILLRTDSHESLDEFASASSVPVVNGLTDKSHPCQLLADVMTFEEHLGSIEGKVVAWLGDGNNVAATWIQAATQFNFEIRIACPQTLQPNPEVLLWAEKRGAKVSVTEDPLSALEGANCVVTDTWVSLSDDQDKSVDILKPFQVNSSKMSLANSDAIFMHCLPAKRGQEVTEDVLDGPASVVFDEAENRMHVQKAILLWCLAPEKLG